MGLKKSGGIKEPAKDYDKYKKQDNHGTQKSKIRRMQRPTNVIGHDVGFATLNGVFRVHTTFFLVDENDHQFHFVLPMSKEKFSFMHNKISDKKKALLPAKRLTKKLYLSSIFIQESDKHNTIDRLGELKTLFKINKHTLRITINLLGTWKISFLE